MSESFGDGGVQATQTDGQSVGEGVDDDPLGGAQSGRQRQEAEERLRVTPGTLQLTPAVVVGIMALWTALVLGYSVFSGFEPGFVVVGVFTGFVALVELTTSNSEPPSWHRWARVVLVIGYVTYGVALVSKFPALMEAIVSLADGLARSVSL